MDQIRIAEVPLAESGRVNLLVSEAFGYASPHTYFDDFPVWASRSVTRIGGYSGDKLVSHVGIQFRNLRTTQTSDPVALIGAVATHPSFQGRGYSTLLMKEAIKRADQAGCNWCFLWGSEHDFYSKFGFQLSGIQARVGLSELFPVGDLRNQLERLNPTVRSGYSPLIFREFLSRTHGIQFKPEDEEWLSLQRTVTWVYQEEPFSFVALGRGMDLQGIVHEFGGDPAGIQSLLFQVLKENPSAQMIASPAELRALGIKPESWVTEGLCLARARGPSLSWNDEFWISGLSAV